MADWIFIAAICSSVFSGLALLISLLAMAKGIGLEKSTHSVQYMPLEVNNEWAEADKKLDEINKSLKEENEEFLGSMGI